MRNRIDVSFSQESFDGKLFLILLLRRISMIIATCIAGGILVCGIYVAISLSSTPQTCSCTSRYKVTYGTDPQTNNEYTYINNVTWNTWVTTDHFVDLVMQQQEAAGLSAEIIASSLSADLETDLRMPTTKVTMSNAEDVTRLNTAVQKAFLQFGEEQLEIYSIDLVDTADIVKTNRIPRVPQALILGVLLGGLLGMIIFTFRFFYEESAVIPETLEIRFGVPAVTSASVRLLASVFKDNSEITLITLGEEPKAEDLARSIEGCCDAKVYIRNYNEDTSGIAVSPSVILVESGRDNGRGLNRKLEELELLGADIKAMVLMNTDPKLLKMYYGKRWEA